MVLKITLYTPIPYNDTHESYVKTHIWDELIMVNQVNDMVINVMKIVTIASVNAGLPGLRAGAAEAEAELAEAELPADWERIKH